MRDERSAIRDTRCRSDAISHLSSLIPLLLRHRLAHEPAPAACRRLAWACRSATRPCSAAAPGRPSAGGSCRPSAGSGAASLIPPNSRLPADLAREPMPFALVVHQIELGIAVARHPDGSGGNVGRAADGDEQRRQLLAVARAVLQRRQRALERTVLILHLRRGPNRRSPRRGPTPSPCRPRSPWPTSGSSGRGSRSSGSATDRAESGAAASSGRATRRCRCCRAAGSCCGESRPSPAPSPLGPRRAARLCTFMIFTPPSTVS